MVTWPKRIKLIRTLLDVTQEKLAQSIGVHKQTVVGWEAGLFEPQKRHKRALSKFCQKQGIVFTDFGMPYEVKEIVSF